MRDKVKYTVFKTKWGYFGLAARGNRLLRTNLPLKSRKKAKNSLLKGVKSARYDQKLFESLQKQIQAYFNGNAVNFCQNPDMLGQLTLDSLSTGCLTASPFAADALKACRKIGFGQTISYKQLAQAINHPNAARAVGSVLAKNPFALIVPCHRVICSNGKVGGFSAAGAVKMKKKLLDHEKNVLLIDKNTNIYES